jgi:hypothetical protein
LQPVRCMEVGQSEEETDELLVQIERDILGWDGANSRTTASYRIRSAEDVAGALELFRMNYERRKEQNGPVVRAE